MAQSYPTLIPGLRSPFAQVNAFVYFGRMLDKIQLAAVGGYRVKSYRDAQF